MRNFSLSIVAIGLLVISMIPDFALAQDISTIKPGLMPDYFCQEHLGNSPSYTIVNRTGFLKTSQLYYDHRIIDDYVLQPGHSGTVIYVENNDSTNVLKGNFQFFHDNMQNSHSGINIQSVYMNTTSNNAYYLITISVSPDTDLGTYWLIFPPGFCSGGSIILLTIGQSTELISPIGSLNAHIENHNPDYVIVVNAIPYNMANLTILDSNGIKQLNDKIMIDPNGISSRWFTASQNGYYDAIITSAIGNVTVPFVVSGVEHNQQNTVNSDIANCCHPTNSAVNETVPEFPFAVLVLLISFVSIIVFYRMRF